MFSHGDITKDLERAKKFFENIISYTIGPFSLDEILENRPNSIRIVDVREYDDYLDGHIPYAQHLPYKDEELNLDILDKNIVTVIYTYSDSCPRAYNSALKLIHKHYPSVVLRGGFKEWKRFDFDIVKNDSSDYRESDNKEE